MKHAIISFCLATLCVAGTAGDAAPTQPTQPTQPEKGPGGSEYAHKSVVRTNWGEGDTEYWMFEPDGPKPETAPLVVFCHGWSAMDPNGYIAWIEHIVKRGNIVVYPRYQANLVTPPDKFVGNSVVSVKNAIKELKSGKHVQPDLEKVSTVGHSYGGVVCAGLAAVAEKNELPRFKAVMPVEPGTGQVFKAYEDYSKIPAGTLLLCVVGEDDIIVKDIDAKKIFKEATQVKKEDKDLVIIRSDRRGKPPMNADHFAPAAVGALVDALDYYGFWKWFDGLTDAANLKKNRQYALGNTPEQRSMGKWSDGTPAVEAKVVKE